MRRLSKTGRVLSGWLMACALGAPAHGDAIADHARQLHFASIVLDTHADTTQRLFTPAYDFGKRNTDGSHVDLPRMRAGGLNAQFFSIWIDSNIHGPPAVEKALDQIDAIRELVRSHPNDLGLATTAEDVRRAHATGKIAALMGVEGGHMLGNDLRMVRVYAALGVRYLTLAHFHNSELADSATDAPVHNGLSEFGRDAVREMNRNGMLVDISHVSDKSFYDALEVSRAPLIASHSSVRSISGHARNMTDEMIRALAAKGGVIQINYEVNYLSDEFRAAYETQIGSVAGNNEKLLKECNGDDVCMAEADKRQMMAAQAAGRLPHVSWEKIVEHIAYVVKLVGPDHVGLGSDFDGAIMPEGMDDCSYLPRITEALLCRGYSDADVRKILGGNMLRVMAAAERVAREMQGQRHAGGCPAPEAGRVADARGSR